METQNLSKASLTEQKFIETPLEIKIPTVDVFDQGCFHFMHSQRLYYGYFGVVPNMKKITIINSDNAIKWIEKELSDQIVKKHYKEYYSKESRRSSLSSVIYILKNQLMIDVDCHLDLTLLFTDDTEDAAQYLLNKLKKFILKSFNSNIYMVIQTERGLTTKSVKNRKPKLLLHENYNDEFLSLHEHIMSELRKKNNNGLFLFHGKPGTGKSTYLRLLVSLLRKKQVIFIPPKLAGTLDSPSFTDLLLANRNSIFVIEDAEDLLLARDAGNESGISMLLNITDGMLGESLGIQVICTFNTALKNIDKALLRKGRLKALYEFDSLSISKSKALLAKFGMNDYKVTEPMTLADIYNVKERSFEAETNKRTPIGFAIHAA